MSISKNLAHTRAYVFIDTEPGRVTRVVQSLRGRLDIPLIDAINGPHNAIAVVEGNNASAVAKAILVDIRKLAGVRNVTVYLATPEEEAAGEGA